MTPVLSKMWELIAASGRKPVRLPVQGSALARAEAAAAELLSERGEASTAARARELILFHAELPVSERLAFLKHLSGGYAPPVKALSEAAAAYLAEPGAHTASLLAQAASSPRRELLSRMCLAPGGAAALIGMRAALLDALSAAPELQPLEDDLISLLAAWLNPGFLELRAIDWNSPAALLEKLIAYEAVHEMAGWGDLRRRLQQDRRCYAFFHPALPGEPLIFVEVALTKGLATKIAPLLSGEVSPAEADTAIFYSISNCQKGLRGIAFGNLLIRAVVEALREEFPSLKQFATLSPIPGFRRWLEKRLKSGGGLLLEHETAALGKDPLSTLARLTGEALDETHILKPVLERLCALYLTSPGERSVQDPVARFHLKNGARLQRINWGANGAPKGMTESFGMMVNYLYDIASIEENHEKFVRDGEIALSPEVTQILRGASLRAPKTSLARLAEAS